MLSGGKLILIHKNINQYQRMKMWKRQRRAASHSKTHLSKCLRTFRFWPEDTSRQIDFAWSHYWVVNTNLCGIPNVMLHSRYVNTINHYCGFKMISCVQSVLHSQKLIFIFFLWNSKLIKTGQKVKWCQINSLCPSDNLYDR